MTRPQALSSPCARLACASGAAAALVGLTLSSCGARTGLLDLAQDAAAEVLDSSTKAESDVALDPASENDAGPEADTAEAPEDVVTEVATFDCEDAGIQYIYLLDRNRNLLRFDPPSLTYSTIGLLNCPDNSGAPNSMAVDRQGVAYVSYADGNLYRVSTTTASCTPTSFVPGQYGWGKYGMGFASDGPGPSEQLYVSEASYDYPSLGLGRIDVNTFQFTLIGAFHPQLGNAVELTGTGEGRLFGLSLDEPGPGTHLVEIDKNNAKVLSSLALQPGYSNSNFAIAHWAGDFFLFLGPASNISTEVWRFHSLLNQVALELTMPESIVGAGVSTCAPKY